MNPQLKTIVRWIGVLPTALICYVAVYAVLKALNQLSTYISGAGAMQAFLIPALAGGGAAFCAIQYGSKIAPNHKNIVAVVLACIIGSFIIFSTIMLIQHFKWSSVVEIVGTIIGIVTGVFHVIEEEKKSLQQVNLD